MNCREFRDITISAYGSRFNIAMIASSNKGCIFMIDCSTPYMRGLSMILSLCGIGGAGRSGICFVEN